MGKWLDVWFNKLMDIGLWMDMGMAEWIMGWIMHGCNYVTMDDYLDGCMDGLIKELMQ